MNKIIKDTDKFQEKSKSIDRLNVSTHLGRYYKGGLPVV